jgi:hypothetical protein
LDVRTGVTTAAVNATLERVRVLATDGARVAGRVLGDSGRARAASVIMAARDRTVAFSNLLSSGSTFTVSATTSTTTLLVLYTSSSSTSACDHIITDCDFGRDNRLNDVRHR